VVRQVAVGVFAPVGPLLVALVAGEVVGDARTADGAMVRRGPDLRLVDELQFFGGSGDRNQNLAEADLKRGRVLFQEKCAKCHKLYGEGGQIGPDLTGSNRNNLQYLLENILDPNRAVPKQWTTTTILLTNGRVINGVVTRQTDQTWTVQTAKEEVAIPAGEIEESQPTNLSLMPEGQLNTMSESDVRDLIAYLQTRQQVPLGD